MNEVNDQNLFTQQGGAAPQEGVSPPGGGDLFGNPFDLGSAGGSYPDPFAEPIPQSSGAAIGASPAPAGTTINFPTPTPTAAAPSTPAPAPQQVTLLTDSGSSGNPLEEAMNQAEEANFKKSAEPVMAQLPVFSYNGANEDIEDITMTFDQLRELKADDFPELDEVKDVSWSVTYGKISKSVTTPKKTAIGDFKREIEGSKEFLDALKKSKDKSPKCILRPKVAMQKKGVLPGYKGVFATLAEARSSDKGICIVPGRDGKVYDLRRTAAGEFITGTEKVSGLDDIRPSFTPALPPIPYTLFEQVVSLFRRFLFQMKDGGPSEALVHIYWDRVEQQYFIDVPKQEVSKAQVVARLDNAALADTERYIHYADIHSHNTMEARFSATDDHEERANRVYIVVGRLDHYYPELSVRACNGGNFLPLRPEAVLEPRPCTEVPGRWLDNIRVLRFDDRKSELMVA